MRSIKEYNKNNSSLHSILGQSLWYARCCILSVSLMSGFGLPWNYDSTLVDKWFEMLGRSEKGYTLPENVKILRAIYKKGDPKFCNTFNENERDYQNFLWDDSSFKKIITPSSQAYLIINEIMLAKYFHKCTDERYKASENNMEKQAISLLLINSAMIQCQFMSDYLRNFDGLFVPKADLTQNPFGEPYLEEDESTPDVSDQAMALKAFSMMASSLNNKNYPMFMNSQQLSVNKKYADEMFEVFQDSPEDIFGSKTRDLCNVISSCIEYYNINKQNDDVFNYIIQLSLELDSRIDMSGNLLRYPDDNKLTSSSSCFIAIKTLIEAYRLTGIYKFACSASALYRKLNLLWDPVNCLYLLDNEDKYKYTSRDVGAIISGLNAIRLFGEDDYRNDAESRLVLFFNSAVNSSSLIHSSMKPPSSSDFEGLFNCLRGGCDEALYSNFCHPDIPLYIECGIAPVFAKKFTFKPKKHKFDINSKSFYSEYVLYTSSEMLCMSYPDIECFHDGKPSSQENIEDQNSMEQPDKKQQDEEQIIG